MQKHVVLVRVDRNERQKSVLNEPELYESRWSSTLCRKIHL